MNADDWAAVGLALAAACCFGVSNVSQMSAVARRSDPLAGIEAGMLARVARDPLWLAGLLASVVGFGLEATALSLAPVVLVQPLIVAELAFALPLAAAIGGRRLGVSDWAGLALVTAGLATVVAVIRPQDAPIRATAAVWAALFATAAVSVAALVAAAHRWPSTARTRALAAAAGITFGVMAVVTKAATHQLGAHGAGFILHWEPWALAPIGLVGMTLAQNTYKAGPLAVSLPLLDLGEPLFGSAIAMLAFHERLGSLGAVATGTLAVGAVAAVAGITVLDRSPLVREAQPSGTAVTKSMRASTAPTSDGSRSA